MNQRVACIDLEGVLIPELWPHIALASGIEELAVTTREVPDYPALVARRIGVLRRHALRLSDVQNMVADLMPLPGAVEFLERLRSSFQVCLISDAFEEMIQPLWRLLGQPRLYCHQFICDEDGFIVSARYSRIHGKHEVIDILSASGAWTLAVGDAFNDLSMLRTASQGILFRPSKQTLAAAQGIAIARSYHDVLTSLDLT